MQNVRQIGRRAWLARMASGLVAVWAGLDVGRGEGWRVFIGRPRTAEATAQPAAQFLRARIVADFRAWASPTNMWVDLKGIEVQAYVVVRGKEAAIVDTLLVNNAATIQDALQTAGLGYDAVRHVILTHYHVDHAGSAAEIAALAPRATFYAGAPDVPAILAGDAAAPVRQPVQAVADGDEVFGLRILATPGHTAGHVSVLDPIASTLMVGDALRNPSGTLVGPTPVFSIDLVAGGRSMQKLAGLGFERALFAHGSEISTGAAAAFAQLLERNPLASDGLSLERQSAATQAAFAAVYGARAGSAWVREHEAELLRRSQLPPSLAEREELAELLAGGLC